MKKYLFIFLTLIMLLSCRHNDKSKIVRDISDTTLILHNEIASLSISRYGGAITGFSFNDSQVNPFTWKMKPADMPENNRNGAPFQGHFLCIGRWGGATSGEKALGMPSNGEPSNNWWTAVMKPSGLSADMSATAKLEQLEVNRNITLSPDQPCFVVTESLKNLQNNGRFTVIVQHATVGPPFLSEKTIISTNATHGFNQSLVKYSPSKDEYTWPDGYADSLFTPLDLTKTDQPEGYVTTHINENEYGWVTASTPANGLMMGYLWKSYEYPWLHLWHGVKDGKPWAEGLEFGTTGLGDTFTPEERAAMTFHGKNNNLFLDAKSSITKKYFCFLAKIPSDFIKTDSITYSEDQVTVNYLTAEGAFKTIFNLKIW